MRSGLWSLVPETFHSDGREGQSMKLQKFQWGGWTSGKIVDRSGERFVELLNDASGYILNRPIVRLNNIIDIKIRLIILIKTN